MSCSTFLWHGWSPQTSHHEGYGGYIHRKDLYQIRINRDIHRHIELICTPPNLFFRCKPLNCYKNVLGPIAQSHPCQSKLIYENVNRVALRKLKKTIIKNPLSLWYTLLFEKELCLLRGRKAVCSYKRSCYAAIVTGIAVFMSEGEIQ